MIVVRRARLEDWPAISSFIQDMYGAQAPFKGEARWRWQFVDNPFRPQDETAPTVWIAQTDQGEVAGQIAVQDGALLIEGERFPAGWIVDVMIRPEFRGRKLGHRIHEAVMQDRSCLVTLTMAPATRRIAEAANCLTLGPTWQMIRPVRLAPTAFAAWIAERASARPGPLGLLRSPLGSTLAGVGLSAALAPFLAVQATGWGKSMADGEVLEASPEEALSAVEALDGAAYGGSVARFDKGRAFYTWRFGPGAPDLAYKALVLTRAGVVRGYTVIREPHRQEHPIGVIVELVTRDGDQEAAGQLVDAAVARLSERAACVEMATADPAVRALAGRRGFFVQKTMYPTVVVPDGPLRDAIARKSDAFRFSKADHDWDQVRPRELV
jgi:hypothetical protein